MLYLDVIDRINLRLAVIGKNGAEMSRDLGLSNSIYSQWNTRKSKPSKKTIAMLAPYLKTTAEYLLTGEEPKKSPFPTGEELSPARQELQKLIENASEEDLEKKAWTSLTACRLV